MLITFGLGTGEERRGVEGSMAGRGGIPCEGSGGGGGEAGITTAIS